MLRSLLLLLACFPAMTTLAQEGWLPKSGQVLEVWNRDLTQRLGQVRAEVQTSPRLYSLLPDTTVPQLHFLRDEQRFSIPGVAATGPAEKLVEPGLQRFIYRGSDNQGSMEKSAVIELVRLENGRCQLGWKLAVFNRGEILRRQEGAVGYPCEERKEQPMRRDAMQLLPRPGS